MFYSGRDINSWDGIRSVISTQLTEHWGECSVYHFFVCLHRKHKDRVQLWNAQPITGTQTSKQLYHQNSDISRTKSQNLNISRLAMQLAFPNPLLGTKSRIKM